MARPKKFTARSLEKAVEDYFDSISREKVLTERRDTGKLDKYGHAVYEEIPILNRRGEPMTVTEFLTPPTVGGLCQALGIHRSTWSEYCDSSLHPEFSDTTARVQGRMHTWREEQLLTRKDVKGIIFDLENNYGAREKREVELGERAVKAACGLPLSDRAALLREIAAEFSTDEQDGE